MNVTEAVLSRRSIRAFLPREVPAELLRDVLSTAARAASGGNLQPWHIHLLQGASLARFRMLMQARLARGDFDALEYDIYPASLHEPYRSRRFRVGEMMYATLGIERENREGRLLQFARNYDFFGAPAGLFCFVDRKMGPPQWSDLGMYLQTVMLLLRERGLDSCAQEAWSVFNQTVSDFLHTPPELMLFCGMSIGHRDPAAPINTLASERAPLDEFVTIHD